MANNINREGFKKFLEFGAPSFEGNIILDSGELSEYYYVLCVYRSPMVSTR